MATVTQIRHNLFYLINELEARKGRDVPLSEIAKATGLSEAGIRRAKNNVGGGVQFDTLERLMDYFNREGLNVTLEDMLIVEQVTEGENSPVLVGKNEGASRKLQGA